MASPAGSPLKTLADDFVDPSLKELRSSASFISDDILNYEPPSHRRARFRALGDVNSSANSSLDVLSDTPTRYEQGQASTPGIPPHMTITSPLFIHAGQAEIVWSGEFFETPALYTWLIKSEVPASNAAFRLTISGRTLVVNVSSTPDFGQDSMALMARSLVLPSDANMAELVCSFHEGNVKIQIARSITAGKSQQSPGPVDTLALARTTEEMMAELSNMLELGFTQPSPRDHGGSPPPTKTLSDSALRVRSGDPSQAAWSADAFPQAEGLGDLVQETRQSVSTIDLAASGTAQQQQTVSLPFSGNSSIPLPVATERLAQRSEPIPLPSPTTESSKCAPGVDVSYAQTLTVPRDTKAKRAAERRAQFLNSAESSPLAPPAESEVLKRCQDLLKRSQEQSKKLLEDVAWPMTPEGQARAAYASSGMSSANRAAVHLLVPHDKCQPEHGEMVGNEPIGGGASSRGSGWGTYAGGGLLGSEYPGRAGMGGYSGIKDDAAWCAHTATTTLRRSFDGASRAPPQQLKSQHISVNPNPHGSYHSLRQSAPGGQPHMMRLEAGELSVGIVSRSLSRERHEGTRGRAPSPSPLSVMPTRGAPQPPQPLGTSVRDGEVFM